jgi:hypothetical protein
MNIKAGTVLVGNRQFSLAEFDRKYIGMELGDPGEEFPFVMRSGRILAASVKSRHRNKLVHASKGANGLLRKKS